MSSCQRARMSAWGLAILGPLPAARHAHATTRPVARLGRLWGVLALHSMIARLGGYRLSLHSGSEKFRVYPALKWATDGNFRIKTSGTSWLTALDVIAERDNVLHRSIVALAWSTLAVNRREYMVGIKKDTTTNQAMHVCYGTAIQEYREAIYGVLWDARERYYELLQEKFSKHLRALQ